MKTKKLKKVKKNRETHSEGKASDKIKKTQERLIVSLAAAWEVAPDDPEIRKQLMATSEKALALREKVYKDILEEKPPDVRESYEKLRKEIEREIKTKS